MCLTWVGKAPPPYGETRPRGGWVLILACGITTERFHMSPDDQPATGDRRPVTRLRSDNRQRPQGTTRRHFIPLSLGMSEALDPSTSGVTWQAFPISLLSPCESPGTPRGSRHALLSPRSGSAITIGIRANSIRTRSTLACCVEDGLGMVAVEHASHWVADIPSVSPIWLGQPVPLGQDRRSRPNWTAQHAKVHIPRPTSPPGPPAHQSTTFCLVSPLAAPRRRRA